MESTDDDATAITPELLADDDQLREALADVCKRTTDANPCRCIEDKLTFLKATLDDGTFAIVAELLEAVTRHHEEVLVVVVRDLLVAWVGCDTQNGDCSSSAWGR